MSQPGCKGSSLAPKTIFRTRTKILFNETAGWQIGSKLEAVDKQNTSLICVASVRNIVDGKILIHFDGWELDYDYWIKADSPYVKPKGYCEKKGLTLNKPRGYRGDFKWDRYLQETESKAVPESAFKHRQKDVSLFRRGMKLEVVDIRNPMHVRVATVAEVSGTQIKVSIVSVVVTFCALPEKYTFFIIFPLSLKVHYDGWPQNYDYWFDDSSPDLHPATWCLKTGHPLMPPLSKRLTKK